MSTPLMISCPHCGTGLKLKNNNFVGKKVPCPKCKKPFLVEEPPEDEFLAGDDEDFEASDDFEDEEPAPRSKSKARGGEKSSSKGKGKKKSKSGGGFAPIAMIAGAVVLGLGVLGGIVYGAMALFSGGGSSSNSWVKWLPDETDVVVQMRVADSINAPIFKPITDHPTLSKLINQPPMPGNGGTNPAAAFFQGLGVGAKDVDTVTVGVLNGMDLVSQNQAGASQSPQQFVAVIRLKTPVDEAKLAQAPATILAKEDYNGKTIYSVVGSMAPKVIVHSVDSTTYLMGSESEIKSSIDGNGKAPAAKRFAFANDKSSFIFVAAPKDPSKLKALGISTLQISRSGATTDTGEVDGIYGMSYGFTLSSDMKIEIRSSLSRSMAKATADQIKKEVDAARPLIQAQMAELNGFNPFVSNDMLKQVLGHFDTMIGTAQASSEGSTASLTMTLSGQVVPDALQAAAPAMPMLETMIANQQAAAQSMQASPMTGMQPGFGNSAMDITQYPAAVINTGENAKDKIGNMADQHNAALQAQMENGGLPSSSPGLPMGAAMAPPGAPGSYPAPPGTAPLTPPGANMPSAAAMAPPGAPGSYAAPPGTAPLTPPGANMPSAAAMAPPGAPGSYAAPPGTAPLTPPGANMPAGAAMTPPGTSPPAAGGEDMRKMYDANRKREMPAGNSPVPGSGASGEDMRKMYQESQRGGAPAGNAGGAEEMRKRNEPGAEGEMPATEAEGEEKPTKPVPKSRSRRKPAKT